MPFPLSLCLFALKPTENRSKFVKSNKHRWWCSFSGSEKLGILIIKSQATLSIYRFWIGVQVLYD